MAVVHIAVTTGSDTASVVASIVAAVSTLVLACFTAWMALKTRDVARETAAAVKQGEDEFKFGQAQLRASNDQIASANALVAEARKERELAAQPMLSAQRPALDDPPIVDLEVTLKNVGLGPAVTCRYIERHHQEGRMTWTADISPHSEVVVKHAQVLDDSETRTLLQWFDASGTCRYAPAAIFAQDALGTKYQFLLTYNPIGQLVVDHVERWSQGLVGGPEWAVSALVWPNNWQRWARRTVTHPVRGSQTVLVTETFPGDGSEVNEPPVETVKEYPVNPPATS